MNQSGKDRIAGREWCEEVLSNMESESVDFRTGFWRRIRRQLDPKELDRGAMTDSRAREFGQDVVDFGKHAGKTYDETPLDYLEWLADQGELLARYVRSRRVQAEGGSDD